jgi:hypothetical protein
MKTIREILIKTVVPATSSVSALAISLPVAEDTFNTSHGALTAANGKAATLLLNTNQAALLKFDLASLPAAFTPTNIASARLKIYVVTARAPGDLVATLITSAWTEAVITNTPMPSFDTTIIGTAPTARVLAKHFVSIDVTAAVVAALNGSGPNFGFLLHDATGQTHIASKEGPSQGPAAELEIEANLAQNGSGSGTFPGLLSVGGDLSVSGNLNVTGLSRQGSETGTSEPAGRGIIIRRLESTNASLGSVVARTDTLTLVRDGTDTGWLLVHTANAGNVMACATGIDAGGNTYSATYIPGPNPYPAGTNYVLLNHVVSFRCIFGNADALGHVTEVSVMCSPNNSSSNWVGHIISSYNQ